MRSDQETGSALLKPQKLDNKSNGDSRFIKKGISPSLDV